MPLASLGYAVDERVAGESKRPAGRKRQRQDPSWMLGLDFTNTPISELRRVWRLVGRNYLPARERVFFGQADPDDRRHAGGSL